VDWEADGTDEWFKSHRCALRIIGTEATLDARLKETAIDEISQAHAAHNEVSGAT